MPSSTNQGVTTRKCNNVLVAQTHLRRENLPEVIRAWYKRPNQ